MAELINPWSLQFTDGRAPSLFNGGLGAYAPFLLLATAGAAYLETQTKDSPNPSSMGFDPVGFYKEAGAYTQDSLRKGEITNGRLAMLAITGFSVQEFLWQEPVIQQTPFFFGL